MVHWHSDPSTPSDRLSYFGRGCMICSLETGSARHQGYRREDVIEMIATLP